MSRRLIIIGVIIVVVVGLLTGIVGQFIGRNFILGSYITQQEFVELNSNFYNLLEKYRFLSQNEKNGPLDIVISKPGNDLGLTGAKEVAVGGFLDTLERGTVTFFRDKVANNSDALLGAYHQSDGLGRGFILTSDGWIVTTNQVLSGAVRSQVAVRYNGEVYPVTKIVSDPLTPAVFVKVAASNLPVLSFDQNETVTLGQTVVALDENGGVTIDTIQNNYYRFGTAKKDLVISSDHLDNYYLTNSSLGGVALGEPVLDEQGKAIGLLLQQNQARVVLPLNNFSSQIDKVLRDGKITRVKLGVDYLLLDQLLISPENNQALSQLNHGALIYKNSTLGFVGVAKNSAAAAADLISGDVILKVDGDEVNQTNSLSRLIQSYQPKAEVNLTVWRTGKEQEVKVVLE
ncbi:MAG: S1C family serine protease [Candidatus Parcubacteria bacterium]|nr:S1C family serine protease [Candidatus Parcubacteria bacterium]